MSIRLENVSYIYSAGTAYEKRALDQVSLTIYDGQFVGIIGHTGSGKSTLIQHFNGLIKPTSGRVFFNDADIHQHKALASKNKKEQARAESLSMRELRSHIGLVFQYPEHQLFEATVLEDVCFGPKNMGMDKESAISRAKEALEQVNFPADLYDESPFDLSGGQKRRVAIAGVLAMEPEVLILDEPTAGLDPAGRDEILDEIKKLQLERKITVILVSHSMEDVAEYVDRIIVMNRGSVAYDGRPAEVFSHYRDLESMGLSAPQVTYLMNNLIDEGFDVDNSCTTVEEAVDSILGALQYR